MSLLPPRLPSCQSAIIASATHELVVSNNVPIPSLEPGMLLVKTIAVAINPADCKLVGPMASEGATAGSDGSGIVLAIASDVSPGRFSVGDRVCAPHASMNPLSPRHGSFAEYVLTAADFTFKIPDGMSFEAAAALPIGIGTMGSALFYSLKIPGHPEDPASKPEFVFVYGGSTASGTIAIQLIRKSGCIPITTCSPNNFALVKRYGAEAVFDYHDPESAAKVKAYTNNALSFALDCYCDASSMKFCYNALGRAGGKYTTLQPYPEHSHTRRMVKPDWVLGSAILGKKNNWKPPYNTAADPALAKYGKQWFATAQRLLDQGAIQPHPIRIGAEGGFDNILKGMDTLREGAVSGQKLVYRI